MKYAIALTGSIATGKSTVANFFKLYGFLVIDADSIAHKLLDNNIHFISNTFGKEYILENKVDRKKLATIIFNNTENRLKLEKFLHPLIKEEIIKEATIFEEKKKPYFIDIPLFFEKKNYDIEKILVVYAPKDIQIQRLMKRNNFTYEEALNRINLQIDIEEKKQKATYLIDNSKDIKYLQKEIDRVKNIILKDFNVSI